MSNSGGDWCLIERDPGIFTELIRGFGVTGVQVEELWSLSPEYLDVFKPIHGLVFLFKWLTNEEDDDNLVTDSRLEKIFFAKQVINNACATQAILSVLLNCNHPDIELGSTLSDFKKFSANFGPSLKGLSLSNLETVRQVHNSFEKQRLLNYDKKLYGTNENIYHFIAYVPIDGRLYELDGLKEGPIDRGEIPKDKYWVEFAKPIIETHIKKYSENDFHFNLMAIISDKKNMYQKRLKELTNNLDSSPKINDINRIEINYLRNLIKEEDQKMKKYQVENIRRKHNYLPLIMEVLKTLADSGDLNKLIKQKKEQFFYIQDLIKDLL